jgi:hypothetical protein
MAAVLIVLLGYHLETPGSVIMCIKDRAVPPASHHGDIGSVSRPDGVRFVLDKVVLRHVFFQVFWFCPVSGISPVPFVRSFIHILATDSVIKHIT